MKRCECVPTKTRLLLLPMHRSQRHFVNCHSFSQHAGTPTDLVGIAVTQHEVRRLHISVHVLVLVDVLQSIQLHRNKYSIKYRIQTHLWCSKTLVQSNHTTWFKYNVQFAAQPVITSLSSSHVKPNLWSHYEDFISNSIHYVQFQNINICLF